MTHQHASIAELAIEIMEKVITDSRAGEAVKKAQFAAMSHLSPSEETESHVQALKLYSAARGLNDARLIARTAHRLEEALRDTGMNADEIDRYIGQVDRKIAPEQGAIVSR